MYTDITASLPWAFIVKCAYLDDFLLKWESSITDEVYTSHMCLDCVFISDIVDSDTANIDSWQYWLFVCLGGVCSTIWSQDPHRSLTNKEDVLVKDDRGIV